MARYDEFDPRSFVTEKDFDRFRKVLDGDDSIVSGKLEIAGDLAILFPEKRSELASLLTPEVEKLRQKNRELGRKLEDNLSLDENPIYFYEAVSSFKMLFPGEDMRELDITVRKLHDKAKKEFTIATLPYYAELVCAVPDILPELEMDPRYQEDLTKDMFFPNSSAMFIASRGMTKRILNVATKETVYTKEDKVKIREFLSGMRNVAFITAAAELVISQADEITFNPGLTLTFHTPLSEEGKPPYPEMEKV